MEDVHEYCRKFKNKIETLVLAGVDTTGETTIQRLETSKKELIALQKIGTKNLISRGHVTSTKLILFVIIFFQLICIAQLISL